MPAKFKKFHKKRFHKKGGIKGEKMDNVQLAIRKIHKYWMTNTVPQRLKMPVPPAYRTTLHCDWNCIYPIAAITSNKMTMLFNDPHLPYAALNANLQTGLDEVGTYNTKMPAGFTQICTDGAFGLYRFCTVIGTKFSVTATLITSGDSFIIGLCPIPVGAATPGSIGAIEQEPRGKTKVMQPAVPIKDRTISISANIAELNGITLEEQLSDFNYYAQATSGVSVNGLVQFRYIIQTIDGAATTAPCNLHHMFTYDVIFHNAEVGALPNV